MKTLAISMAQFLNRQRKNLKAGFQGLNLASG